MNTMNTDAKKTQHFKLKDKSYSSCSIIGKNTDKKGYTLVHFPPLELADDERATKWIKDDNIGEQIIGDVVLYAYVFMCKKNERLKDNIKKLTN